MKRTKQLTALLCAALLLTGTACGKTETQTTVPAAETSETASRPADVPATTEMQAQPDQEKEESVPQEQEDSSATEEESTQTPQITLEAGLNSTDVEEVLAFYKLAAAKNDSRKYTKALNLISLNGGEGKVGSYVHVFEPIAKKAVAKNTVTDDPLPGKYATIRPEDWRSASAVSDGKTTTIRVQVVPQTDGAKGKAFEGPVGRSMTVLDGVDQAVNEMTGVSADFDNGKMRIEYQNPTITVKVDNRTGAFIPGSCKWYYRVNTVLESLDAKVLAFNVHLQNASGVIDYTITY